MFESKVRGPGCNCLNSREAFMPMAQALHGNGLKPRDQNRACEAGGCATCIIDVMIADGFVTSGLEYKEGICQLCTTGCSVLLHERGCKVPANGEAERIYGGECSMHRHARFLLSLAGCWHSLIDNC